MDKSLSLDVISIFLLIIACAIGWFDIPSTLFYISSEVVVYSLMIAVLYAISNRYEQILSIVFAAVFISIVVFFSAFLPAYFSHTFDTQGLKFKPAAISFLVSMIKVTWPLIIVKVVLSTMSVLNKDTNVKLKESNLFKNLIVALFTSIGIGLLVVFFLNQSATVNTMIIIFGLVFARILSLAYINKTAIKDLLNKKA